MISPDQKKQMRFGALFAIIIFLIPYVGFAATSTTTCSYGGATFGWGVDDPFYASYRSVANQIPSGTGSVLPFQFSTSTCVTVSSDSGGGGGGSVTFPDTFVVDIPASNVVMGLFVFILCMFFAAWFISKKR